MESTQPQKSTLQPREYKDQMLLSPQDNKNLNQHYSFPQTTSQASHPLEKRFEQIHSFVPLPEDDSLLLSKQESDLPQFKLSNKINEIALCQEISLPDIQNPEKRCLEPQYSFEDEERHNRKEEDIERDSAKMNQFQTIKPSQVYKSNQAIQPIVLNQKTQGQTQSKEKEYNFQINILKEQTQCCDLSAPISPSKQILKASNVVKEGISKAKKEKDHDLINSQDKLMNLLTNFSQNLIKGETRPNNQIDQQKPNRQMQIQARPNYLIQDQALKHQQVAVYSADDSMNVNLSSEKINKSYFPDQYSQQKRINDKEKIDQPMEIEYEASREKEKFMIGTKGEIQEIVENREFQMQIEESKQVLQQISVQDQFEVETTKKYEKYHIQPIQQKQIQITNSLVNNNIVSEKETCQLINDSKNFSLEVNFNDDSLPAFLDKDSSNPIPEMQQRFLGENQNVTSQGDVEHRTSQLCSENTVDKIKTNQKEHLNLKQHDSSSEFIEFPCVSLKNEQQQQQIQGRRQAKHQLLQRSLQASFDVIPCKVNGFGQGLRQQNKQLTFENNNILQASERIESKQSQQIINQLQFQAINRNEVSLVNHQCNQIPQQQALQNNVLQQQCSHNSQVHLEKDLSKSFHIDETGGRDRNKSEDFHLMRDPNPSLPPCVSIKINKHHEISLNIFNNNPYPKQQRETGVMTYQQVQHEFTSINENNTFLDQVPMRSNKKEAKFEKKNYNSSIDLERIQQIHTFQQVTQTDFSEETKAAQIPTEQMIQQQYDRICVAADKYLEKKNKIQSDHQLLQNLVKKHLEQRLTPTPLTPVGTLLYKNGLFLVALANLITRNSNSPYMAYYVYEFFTNFCNIEVNKYIFLETSKKVKEQYLQFREKQFWDTLNQFKAKSPNLQEQKIRRAGQENRFQSKQLPIQKTVEEKAFKNKQKTTKNFVLTSNFYSVNQTVCKNQTKNLETQAQKNKQIYQKIKNNYLDNESHKLLKPLQSSSKNGQERDEDLSLKKVNSISKEIMKPKKNEIKIQESPLIQKTKNQKTIQQNEQESDKNQKQGKSQNFTKLYQKFKSVKDQLRITSSNSKKEDPPIGILKNTSLEKGNQQDSKKKKNVQFVQDQNQSKEISNEDEADIKPRRKRRNPKSKAHSEDHQSLGRHRLGSRK